MRLKFAFVISALLLLLIAMKLYGSTQTFSHYGSTGSEVREIQSRLKSWGYYGGSVDGIYGMNTVNSVKGFQRKNGLTPDGVCGTRTLSALGITSTSKQNTPSISSSDRDLIARVINAEARGEPYSGQVAVGAVILNRVQHPSFPKTIPGVIYQPGAFTCIEDGQINAQMTDSPRKAAQDALNGWDPCYGAIYYYNPAKTTNKWMLSRPQIITIGKHIFTR